MSKAVGLAVCLAGGALLAGCNQGASAPEETVQQLMANKVQPTADVYWKSIQWISDVEGQPAREVSPQTDADWEKVRLAAVRLGEYGELLQTPAYSEGREQNWTRFSQGLVDISKRAEQAAANKDKDAVFEVGGTIYNVCSACHMAYPAESAAGTASET